MKTKDLADDLIGLAKVLPQETLFKILKVVKMLKTWEKSLEESRRDINRRERKLKSDYSALMSSKREIEKNK